ncbi:putative polysaccharide biosynthesis protein [Rhodobacteraceae bacterium KLH11]|nr:putative polysaccharide biosynthesis protein [Rhodobacteraceae bacterium KLH11]
MLIPRLPDTARTKIANVGWMLGERGIGVLIAFFVMTLVARALGPEGFGAYVYIFSVTMLLSPIAHFGMSEILVRESVARPTDRHAFFGSAMALTSFFAFISVLAGIAIVAVFGGPSGVTPWLMLLACSQLMVIPIETTWAWFKADERMGLVVVPRIIVALGIAMAAIYLVQKGYGLAAFVALRAVEQASIGLAALLVFAWATGALHRLKVSRREIRHLLSAGLPLMISMMATILYMRIDQVMLGQMAPADELGRYGLAVRVSEVALVVPMALGTSFFASIIRAEARGTLPEQSQRLYDAMTLATLLAGVTLAVAAIFLFEPTFGPAFADGLWPTLVLILGLPFYSWGIAREKVLLARRQYWLTPVIALCGAALNIGLNLALIPHFGGIGAAWATVATFLATAIGVAIIVPALRSEARGMLRSLNLWRATQRLHRALT